MKHGIYCFRDVGHVRLDQGRVDFVVQPGGFLVAQYEGGLHHGRVRISAPDLPAPAEVSAAAFERWERQQKDADLVNRSDYSLCAHDDHFWAAWGYGGRGAKTQVHERCPCGATRTRPAKKSERQGSPFPKKGHSVHEVWWAVERALKDKTGYAAVTALERVARRHPDQISVATVDDSSYMGSRVALVDHVAPKGDPEDETRFHGTTLVYTPQNAFVDDNTSHSESKEDPTRGYATFFLYPGHVRGLLEELVRRTRLAARHGEGHELRPTAIPDWRATLPTKKDVDAHDLVWAMRGVYGVCLVDLDRTRGALLVRPQGDAHVGGPLRFERAAAGVEFAPFDRDTLAPVAWPTPARKAKRQKGRKSTEETRKEKQA